MTSLKSPQSRHSDHSRLAEFFPIKPIGAFLALDFVLGCSFGCRFCISRRHRVREALFRLGKVLPLPTTPEEVCDWLESMPSYRAGVQIRVGHDSDAGLQFEPMAELVRLLPADKSIVLLSRRPLTERARAFFAEERPHVLLKLTATPRSPMLGVTGDPLILVGSTLGLSDERLFWVVGPLAADSEAEAARVIDALPAKSHVHLKPLNTAGLPELAGMAPISPEALARLEARAVHRGLTVTEWFCRRSLAPIGRGFFDVDKIATQAPGPKRERELAVCQSCPSRDICHAPLDESALVPRLLSGLAELGLTPLSAPRRMSNRRFEIDVAEPASRGDETWLAHALGEPVSVRLSTREKGQSEGGAFCNVEDEVLRRWEARGFLPVRQLRHAARRILEEALAVAGPQLGSLAPCPICRSEAPRRASQPPAAALISEESAP